MKLIGILATSAMWVMLAPAGTAQTSEAEDLLGKGRELMAAGKFEQAGKAYKQANKKSGGKCAACYLGIAMAHAKLGNAEDALESSDKALQHATDDATRALAHNMRGHAVMALASEQPKRLPEAESAFRQALQLQPNDANFHLNLGVALAKLMRNDEAIKEFEAAASLTSANDVRDVARSFATNPRKAREPFVPPFELSSLNGETITLDQFAGKIVVLDFWATWCPPCRAAVPEIKDMIKKYGSNQLVVISISWDENEKEWRDYIAKHEMNWVHARDVQAAVSGKLGVRAVPTYLVVDGDGFIKERIVGTNPQQSVAYRLREKLQSMPELAKK